MRYQIISFILLLSAYSCQVSVEDEAIKTLYLPVDPQATSQTKKLYEALKERMKRGIMFGHQNDLAYGYDWVKGNNRSDVHDVCNDYPAVFGWELGGLETGNIFNSDSIEFGDLKRYIKSAHQMGAVNTISWKPANIVTKGLATDYKGRMAVRSILSKGYYQKQYFLGLDRLATFFSNLRGNKGELIPVVLRMYPKCTGSRFWWGEEQCTAEEFKQLWIMTVAYLRDTKGVHNLLYAYSPAETETEAMFLKRYPGDEFVDIIGLDYYVPGKDKQAAELYRKRMDSNLTFITTYAARVNKVPVIGETGMESVADSVFFTQMLYPLIKNYKISWVMLGENARRSKSETAYYVPFKGHSACKDFRIFSKIENIYFCNDLKKLADTRQN